MKWITLAVVGLLATPALADDKNRFDAADTNNDGLLSQREFFAAVEFTSQKYFFQYEENGSITRSGFERVERRERQKRYRESL